jgi:uncharacterized protein (DUF2344 family)
MQKEQENLEEEQEKEHYITDVGESLWTKRVIIRRARTIILRSKKLSV